MLNKYIRSTIIILIQVIVPVGVILILAPHMIQSQNGFNQVEHFFITHKTSFLMAHISFYLVLFWLWPRIIYFYMKQTKSESTTEQIQSALKAKWYLLTTLAFFELMVWWR